LPASELVPGDVVQLAAGDLVPADGRVLQARDFFVRQATLTGESFPVEKHAGDLPTGAADVVDAANAAFMGSSVLSGSARLLVCCTGAASAARERALARFEALSRDGFRVLAIAWRTVPPEHAHAVVDDETQLVLGGYAAFLDPPKAGAAEALARLRRSHVEIKVLTGDNEWVTRHLCRQVGLAVKGLLTGAQLDDHALRVQARRANLYCRVSPPQKSRILHALRARACGELHRRRRAGLLLLVVRCWSCCTWPLRRWPSGCSTRTGDARGPAPAAAAA
jgi:magnesium-transporting ATPase (P-type)